jgi:Anticodon binding domain.
LPHQEDLIKKNIDVLSLEVDEGMGNKLKKDDLLGIGYQIIIGYKTRGDNFEFKEVDKESKVMNLGEILQTLRN